MIVRDMYCGSCGTVRPDVMLPNLGVLAQDLECHGCQRPTTHLPVCNGGIKTRFRQQDWPSDPAFYRGQVTCSAPTATVGEDGPSVEALHGGGAVHAASKFTSEDKRAERRDMQYHETDRRRGTLPIVCDMKG